MSKTLRPRISREGWSVTAKDFLSGSQPGGLQLCKQTRGNLVFITLPETGFPAPNVGPHVLEASSGRRGNASGLQ